MISILQKPDSLSLLGNMKSVIFRNLDTAGENEVPAGDVTLLLADGSGQQILARTYSPDAGGRMEVDLRDVISAQLAFTFSNIDTPWHQESICGVFKVTLSDAAGNQADTGSFAVLRAGVERFADTAANFLAANFLTWQPSTKGVTYYTPEFLTYYNPTNADVTLRCRPFSQETPLGDMTLCTIPPAQAWTVPVGYAVIAASAHQLPSHYDVWVQNAGGERLTYIQRYYAQDMRSEQEQWILFENSLGGIDTFRAYGESSNTAEHTHNVAEIEEVSQEYRVDTERKFKKNTGRLDRHERLWLLDFFPSQCKYIYIGQYLRQIVVTESDVDYNASQLPTTYTFTYKYADSSPYLNLPRTDIPLDVLSIQAPDLASFTVAPRLVEFPRTPLSDGALFPVQDPNSEVWGTTTFAALFNALRNLLGETYQGDGGVGHQHSNLPFLEILSWDSIRQYFQRLFLSKTDDDTAHGQITHEKKSIHENGLQLGEQFIPGLVGRGGSFDGKGNGELRSLKLWEWLEVPELRYNRVSVYTGIRWDTFGGGIIETITPDSTGAETGSGTLKLEDGEYGAIAVGDLCMGIWHDRSGNATVNTDDNIGNFTFAGFKTVYFLITEVGGTNNQNFKYLLRARADGGNGFHPFVGMTFACRGNISNTERQSFRYTTTEYSLSLTGVSTWEFQAGNYYEITGHIEGFSMPAIDVNGNLYTKVFHGYGQVFGNAYIFGQIDTFERVAYRMFIEQSLGGALAPGETEDVSCTILNGYGADVTGQFTHFSVTRNTGDAASDAVWNTKHTNVGNPFQISFADLGIDGIHRISATFNVTATDEATNDTAQAQANYFS